MEDWTLDRRSTELLLQRVANEVQEGRQKQLLPGDVGEAFVEFRQIAQRVGGMDKVGERNAEVHRWRSDVAALRSTNAVFMDTTTLYAATNLVDSTNPDALLAPCTLLDLATFVRSVVIYDQIFHFENYTVNSEAVNEALGNEPVLIPLHVEQSGHGHYGHHTDVQTRGVGAFLGNRFEDTLQELKSIRRSGYTTFERQQFNAMLKAWSVVVGREISREDVIDEDEGHHWRSNGPQLVSALLSFSDWPAIDFPATEPEVFKQFLGENALRRLISECNHRSLFNAGIASLLEMPYAAGVGRLPFRDFQFRTANTLHESLLTIKEIEKHLAERRPSYSRPDDQYPHLPVFLSIVLKRCKSLDSFYEVLAELRAGGADFRRHRADYERALNEDRNPHEIEKLRRAINADAAAWRKHLVAPTAAAVAAVLAAVTGGTSLLALMGIGLLTAVGQLDSDKREQITRRLLRPQEWFLTSVSNTALAIANSLEDVRRLWGKKIDESQYAARFAQYRQLGYA